MKRTLALLNNNSAKVKDYLRSFINLFYTKKQPVYIIWFIAFICAAIKIFVKGGANNYLIFKYVYFHAIDEVNLYIRDASLYGDCNHYGPLFSLVIAPFLIFPDIVGVILFCGVMAMTMAIAINYLPVDWKSKAIIYLVTANDLFITTLGCETNTLIIALIIGAFIAINKGKDFWAACFIMFGFFIKLYSIVGLVFFLFSKHKIKLTSSLIFWAVVFFVLPMLITSPGFVIQSYFDWHISLLEKNMENANSLLQDLSVMGMMRRISGNRELSNMIILMPAFIIFGLQFVKYKLYDNMTYRLLILASVLLSVVLFSSSSESPTYIIAITGVAIWFTQQNRPYSKIVIGLFVFVIVFSSFSTSDLIPHFIRLFWKTYALKALPCLLVWLYLVSQILSEKIITEKKDKQIGERS